MAKSFKAKKPERYQAIGFRPSKKLVVTIAILISVGLVGSVLASALFSLPNAFGPNVAGIEGQIKTYQDTLKSNPNDINTRILLGHAHFDYANDLSQKGKDTDAQKNYSAAEAEYKKVLEKQPDNPEVAGNLSIVYFYTNRVDDAIKTAQNSLEKNPDYYTTRTNYGIFLGYGKQDYINAIKELEKIPSTAPDYNRAQDLIKEFNNSLATQPGPLSPQGQTPQKP